MLAFDLLRRGAVLPDRAGHGPPAAGSELQDAQLKAFNETFLLVALFCALAVFAAVRMRSADQ